MVARPSTQRSPFVLDVLWRGLAALARHGVSLLLFVMCTRLLTPLDLGLYSYLLAVLTLAATLMDFGLSSAAARFVAHYREIAPELVGAVWPSVGLILLALAGLVGLFLLTLGPLYFQALQPLVLLCLPAALLASLAALLDGIYCGLRRFRTSSIVALGAALATSAAAWPLIRGLALPGALLAQTLLYLLLVGGLLLGRRTGPLRPRRQVAREVGGYAAILGLNDLCYFFYGSVDTLVLGHYGYFTETGYYEMALKVLLVATAPSLVISQVLAPDMAAHMASGRYAELRRSFRRWLGLSLALALSLLLGLHLGKGLLAAQLGASYNPTLLEQLLTLMEAVLFTQVLNGVIPHGFARATGHARLSLHILIIFGGLNFLFDILFIRWFGFLGVVYATLGTRCAADLMFLVLYSRILQRLDSSRRPSEGDLPLGRESE